MSPLRKALNKLKEDFPFCPHCGYDGNRIQYSNGTKWKVWEFLYTDWGHCRRCGQHPYR